MWAAVGAARGKRRRDSPPLHRATLDPRRNRLCRLAAARPASDARSEPGDPDDHQPRLPRRRSARRTVAARGWGGPQGVRVRGPPVGDRCGADRGSTGSGWAPRRCPDQNRPACRASGRAPGRWAGPCRRGRPSSAQPVRPYQGRSGPGRERLGPGQRPARFDRRLRPDLGLRDGHQRCKGTIARSRSPRPRALGIDFAAPLGVREIGKPAADDWIALSAAPRPRLDHLRLSIRPAPSVYPRQRGARLGPERAERKRQPDHDRRRATRGKRGRSDGWVERAVRVRAPQNDDLHDRPGSPQVRPPRSRGRRRPRANCSGTREGAEPELAHRGVVARAGSHPA